MGAGEKASSCVTDDDSDVIATAATDSDVDRSRLLLGDDMIEQSCCPVVRGASVLGFFPLSQVRASSQRAGCPRLRVASCCVAIRATWRCFCGVETGGREETRPGETANEE